MKIDIQQVRAEKARLERNWELQLQEFADTFGLIIDDVEMGFTDLSTMSTPKKYKKYKYNIHIAAYI